MNASAFVPESAENNADLFDYPGDTLEELSRKQGRVARPVSTFVGTFEASDCLGRCSVLASEALLPFVETADTLASSTRHQVGVRLDGHVARAAFVSAAVLEELRRRVFVHPATAWQTDAVESSKTPVKRLLLSPSAVRGFLTLQPQAAHVSQLDPKLLQAVKELAAALEGAREDLLGQKPPHLGARAFRQLALALRVEVQHAEMLRETLEEKRRHEDLDRLTDYASLLQQLRMTARNAARHQLSWRAAQRHNSRALWSQIAPTPESKLSDSLFADVTCASTEHENSQIERPQTLNTALESSGQFVSQQKGRWIPGWSWLTSAMAERQRLALVAKHYVRTRNELFDLERARQTQTRAGQSTLNEVVKAVRSLVLVDPWLRNVKGVDEKAVFEQSQDQGVNDTTRALQAWKNVPELCVWWPEQAPPVVDALAGPASVACSDQGVRSALLCVLHAHAVLRQTLHESKHLEEHVLLKTRHALWASCSLLLVASNESIDLLGVAKATLALYWVHIGSRAARLEFDLEAHCSE